MRSELYTVDNDIEQAFARNPTAKFLMIRNEDAANTLLVQFGDSPGRVEDFWQIRPGEVLVLDPVPEYAEMIQAALWWTCPTIAQPNTINVKVVRG